MENNKRRCKWCNLNSELYVDYHDNEWGVESHDDKYLFELLILESFQAGLSWECILNKRENFRSCFDNFDYEKVSNYDEEKINELMNTQGIIRNRRKIEAAINNAKIFMRIIKEYGSFNKFIWAYTNNLVIIGDGTSVSSSLSDKISADLRKKGMKFVGSTIIYSYLQAIGIISDHEDGCFCKKD